MLVAVTCLLYAPDLSLGFFHLDDPTYITNNPHINGFTAENIKFVLTRPYSANFSPVHLLSYMLDYMLSGEDARAFHLSSNIWAGLVAGMVYLLALVVIPAAQMPPQGGKWPPAADTRVLAFCAALLFMVHPAHVEAVAWISSRKDLVAAAFAVPSMVCYFQYRQGGRRARSWYLAGVALFLVGLAGKLSVIVLPGVLWLFDIIVERRRFSATFADKVPFVLAALFFGLRVMHTQPPTRTGFDLFVFGHSTLLNLWLLTGFGDYVMARGRPDLEVPGLFLVATVVLFLVPLLFLKLLRGRITVLLYFVLLALVPSQVLSFIHPVSDRYLFFPSVGVALLAVLLLAKAPRFAALALVLLLLTPWTAKTRASLGDWGDPRSVWYASARVSDDAGVFQYLGTHYQDAADHLETTVKNAPDDALALAAVAWPDGEGLTPLEKEWTAAFKAHLHGLAEAEYQRALEHKGRRVMPNLYFRLGKIAIEERRLDDARSYFSEAYTESKKHTSQDVREELAVRSHHALGLVEWTAANYPAALTWLKQAEAEQQQFGGRWVPEVTQQRQRLERLLQ